MKKLKSSLCQDRLSELPESLILHILGFLPITDVVRTTILSKYWKNLWTSTSCLDLDFERRYDWDSIRDFVNSALFYWNSSILLKMKMNFSFQIDEIDEIDEIEESLLIELDHWVDLALGKKVKELYVHLHHDLEDYEPAFEDYRLPQYLYSCSWLEAISLKGCVVQVSGIVKWDNLKSLTIHDGSIVPSSLEKILCGSPRLEVLVVSVSTTSEYSRKWSIRSGSLKRLWIRNNFQNYIGSRGTELRIRTPNLETLEISGFPFRQCWLMDMASLTDATLGFSSPYPPPAMNDILRRKLRQILPAIQQVKSVALSDWCIQVLGDMQPSSLLNANFLTLKNHHAEYKQIVGVLKNFPRVKVLALEGTLRCDSQLEHKPLEFDTNLPQSFLQHLRTIQITFDEDRKLIFPLIEMLLKHASKLEKMVLRGMLPSDSQRLALRELLMRIPRSSPTAQLIFF